MKRPVFTADCITALLRARCHLAVPSNETGYRSVPGHKQFICLALATVSDGDVGLRQATDYLRDQISERLGQYATLESWLLMYVPEAAQKHLESDAAFDYQAYRTRLAWIDSLIAELEAGKL